MMKPDKIAIIPSGLTCNSRKTYVLFHVDPKIIAVIKQLSCAFQIKEVDESYYIPNGLYERVVCYAMDCKAKHKRDANKILFHSANAFHGNIGGVDFLLTYNVGSNPPSFCIETPNIAETITPVIEFVSYIVQYVCSRSFNRLTFGFFIELQRFSGYVISLDKVKDALSEKQEVFHDGKAIEWGAFSSYIIEPVRVSESVKCKDPPDIFISYRQQANPELSRAIYESLTSYESIDNGRRFRVFWDHEGLDFDLVTFAVQIGISLINTKLFLPIISPIAIREMNNKPGPDYLLLEWWLAVIFKGTLIYIYILGLYLEQY